MSPSNALHCVTVSELETMYLVKKTETFVKLFFILSLLGLVMYAVLAFFTLRTAFSNMKNSEQKTESNLMVSQESMNERFDKDLRYILLWSTEDHPYELVADGQQLLIANNCSHINCYVTSNKTLLNNDIRNFDAIVVSIKTLTRWKKNIPQRRNTNQKYVFYSMVSAEENPVCHILTENFFNWTWTYRLHSDIVTPFIEVMDLEGTVIAPKNRVDWFYTTADFNLTTFENIVMKKTKAVMWKSDCEMNTEAETFVKKLRDSLKEHSLVLDVFDCNHKKCPESGCAQLIDRDYYFYLTIESSSSEDYVTKNVLDAYHNNAVPIVSGGADYDKFLPPGSYINVKTVTVEELAASIAYAIRTPQVYLNYFTWKQFYNIRAVDPQRGYCNLCEMLNDKSLAVSSTYDNFRKWWYQGFLRERCYPKGAERMEDVLSYVDERQPDILKKYYAS